MPTARTTSTTSTTSGLARTPPRWVNRAVARLLRTPGTRALLGRGVALITVTGAVTGRRYTTPVEYTRLDDGRFVVLSQPQRRWWRNVESHPEVTLLVRGEEVAGHAAIARAGDARAVLVECLAHRPRLATAYRLTSDRGTTSALDELASRLVVIVVTPDAQPAGTLTTRG